MDIDSRQEGAALVVALKGKLDTNTTPPTEQALQEFRDGGTSKMLIDFTNLDYISSAGLRLLLATAKGLKSAGGELRVCSLNKTVKEVFDISGFAAILNVYDSEEEGLADFR